MSSNSPGQQDDTTASGSTEGRPSSGNNNNNSRRGNRPPPNKFKGATEALEGYTFDVTAKGEVYTNVVRKISDYVAREFEKAGEFRLAMQSLKLEALTPPQDLEDGASFMQKEKWKLKFAEYEKRKETRRVNSQRIYPVITGQCSPALMARIEAHEDYEGANNDSDVIELLRIIRQCINQKATRRNKFHAITVAYTELMACRQGQKQAPRDYYDTYMQKVDTLIDLGGDLSMSPLFQTDFMTDNNVSSTTDCQKQIHERFISANFLLKADKSRYGRLIDDVINQYSRGQDGFPTSMHDTLNMLTNYVNSSAASRTYQQVALKVNSNVIRTKADEGVVEAEVDEVPDAIQDSKDGVVAVVIATNFRTPMQPPTTTQTRNYSPIVITTIMKMLPTTRAFLA